MKVLKLSAQGLPQSWISLEQAVIHYAAGEVRWESGGEVAVFHGGHNAMTGQQSIIKVNSIIGTRGVPSINPFNLRPGLTNAKLFIRDRIICIAQSYLNKKPQYWQVFGGDLAQRCLNKFIAALPSEWFPRILMSLTQCVAVGSSIRLNQMQMSFGTPFLEIIQ